MKRHNFQWSIGPIGNTLVKRSLFSREWLSILVFICLIALSAFSFTAFLESKVNASEGKEQVSISASEILGNSYYRGVCYGGYRDTSRMIQPTIEEIKEDLKILSAIGVKIVRTYNTKYDFAHNVVRAIHELRSEDPSFEMYVMLGAWIQCKDANTLNPDHSSEDSTHNEEEIARAINIAVRFPDIVKIIVVGNEAMVHWQANYFVQPDVILRWVRHLQELKEKEILQPDLWITSSDNFASWGGGDSKYHNEDLNALIRAVDYVSMHTYPMHDTHYNPEFWGLHEKEAKELADSLKIRISMERALDYAVMQYESTIDYIASVDPSKPVHIGETGWATHSSRLYGDFGSKATDEYKSGMYYKMINDWADKNGITCFYFEAFDEIWKDRSDPGGSENHFGLFDINGKAKYAVWEHVDNGALNGHHRGGHKVVKTYNGDKKALMERVELPPLNSNLK